MTAEDFQAFSEALVKVRAPPIIDSLESKGKPLCPERERGSDSNEIVYSAGCFMPWVAGRGVHTDFFLHMFNRKLWTGVSRCRCRDF